MSKLLANQIANYNDNGPVEVKDGVNIPTGKPLQVAGGTGTSGDYLKSTGSSVAWTTFPTNLPGGMGEDHIKIDTGNVAAETVDFSLYGDDYGYTLGKDVITFGDEPEKPSDPA